MEQIKSIGTFSKHIDIYYDTDNQLPQYLIDKAKEILEENDRTKANLCSAKEVEERKERIRKSFTQAIGGMDIEKTPLNPVETGSFDFEGFTVHNVVYQSQPEFYVTANLYVPHNIAKRNPAVLMACGHSDIGKACDTYQAAAIDMANNGLIVLVVDPISQGERFQFSSSLKTGEPMGGSCCPEHNYLGQLLDLTGGNIAQIMAWDLIRGFDYLASLPYVDENRIGMTGNSGGGTQTDIMAILEPRLACAMPCCFNTSKIDYMKTQMSQDAEQNAFGMIANGIDFDDYLTCMAPKPVRIGAAEYDFFCIEGAIKTYNNCKHIWSLYGKEENISMVTARATHGLSTTLRQGIVNFFRKHLLGADESFIAEANRPLIDIKLLQVTKTGQVVGDYPNMKNVQTLNIERYEKTRFAPIESRSELKTRVRSFLHIAGDVTRDRIAYPRVIADITKEGYREQKVFFFSEADICCTGILIEKADSSRHNVTILTSEGGTTTANENLNVINSLLADGAVFCFDPRGIGAVRSREVYPYVTNDAGEIYSSEFKLNLDAEMLGTSLLSLRVVDILRAGSLMKDYFGFDTVDYAGCDYAALDALCAASLDDAYAQVFGNVPVFKQIIKQEGFLSRILNFQYGLLNYLDTPEMLAILKKP